MKILGINDGHDTAACLYRDGQIHILWQEEHLDLYALREPYGLG